MKARNKHSNKKDGGVMKGSVRLLLSLALIGALASSAQTAPTETQPKIQAPSALTKPSAPVCPPPCLSPEQQAALVEARKILQEARQVAEGITIPEKGMFTRESVLKILRDNKSSLLGRIKKARLRAGDFSNSTETDQLSLGDLALAQARYGLTQMAVQTASRVSLDLDSLVILAAALLKAGDIEGALKLVDADSLKETLGDNRYLKQASVLSLIAREQKKTGEQVTRVTLQRALMAANSVKHPSYKYLALVNLAKSQAVFEERTASTEAFQRAVQAALSQREDLQKAHALRIIAKAQVESGDQVGSDQTFRQAVQLSNNLDTSAKIFVVGCIAATQMANSQRAAGAQTFQQAVQVAESLPATEKSRELKKIGDWQIKAGDREAAAETIQRMLRNAETIANTKGKADVLTSAASLAILAGYPKLAMEIATKVSDEGKQAGILAFVARTLIETKDPFGTPEVFQKLVRSATTLLQGPFPSDQYKADFMRISIAVVQAASGDVPAALHTVGSIPSSETQIYGYEALLQILVKKGDLDEAQKVAAGIKDEWIPFGKITERMRELAMARAKSGDTRGALSWARELRVPYARSYAMLGLAEGILERNGVELLRSKEAWPDRC